MQRPQAALQLVAAWMVVTLPAPSAWSPAPWGGGALMCGESDSVVDGISDMHTCNMPSDVVVVPSHGKLKPLHPFVTVNTYTNHGSEEASAAVYCHWPSPY